MSKRRVDKTSKLFAWLDANAKIVAKPADLANGSGQETIFAVPLSKEKEFCKEFYAAFADKETVYEFGWPEHYEIWDVVTGDPDPHPGPYEWSKRGFDFDGLYERGVRGKLECLKYWSFRESNVYWMNTWPNNYMRLQFSLDTYADGTARMLYTVCIVDDTDNQNKETTK